MLFRGGCGKFFFFLLHLQARYPCMKGSARKGQTFRHSHLRTYHTYLIGGGYGDIIPIVQFSVSVSGTFQGSNFISSVSFPSLQHHHTTTITNTSACTCLILNFAPCSGATHHCDKDRPSSTITYPPEKPPSPRPDTTGAQSGSLTGRCVPRTRYAAWVRND